MISAVISSALQLGLVLMLCLGAYVALRKPAGSFAEFVGLKRTGLRAVGVGALLGLGLALAILAIPGVAELASGRGTVVGNAAERSREYVLAVLLISAIFKTALTEELLFRGLIGKSAIRRFGFGFGNTLQATLFGLVHLLLLLVPQATAALVSAFVAITACSGWLNGWLNERMGHGSILPGWAAHATANACAYVSLALALPT